MASRFFQRPTVAEGVGVGLDRRVRGRSTTFTPQNRAAGCDYCTLQHYTVQPNSVICLIQLPKGQLDRFGYGDNKCQTRSDDVDKEVNEEDKANVKDKANEVKDLK